MARVSICGKLDLPAVLFCIVPPYSLSCSIYNYRTFSASGAVFSWIGFVVQWLHQYRWTLVIEICMSFGENNIIALSSYNSAAICIFSNLNAMIILCFCKDWKSVMPIEINAMISLSSSIFSGFDLVIFSILLSWTIEAGRLKLSLITHVFGPANLHLD